MSKKEYERKQREDQEAAAHVFQDFITTFQSNSTAPNKTFVKSGILYGEKNIIESESGKLYNPQPVIKSTSSSILKNAVECAKILKDNKLDRIKKHDKPKSNLELLKEELKLRHKERDGRVKLKVDINPPINYPDGEDPNSTNLFVANLGPRVTENDLMLLFGVYGPLASVKIMWPRGEDKTRSPNCGFVAFMSRKDAQRALNNLKHREDMRVGWGKFVEVPQHPMYIPNSLLKMYLPPPASGLPFNAQSIRKNNEKPTNVDDLQEILFNSTVKVTIPFDKKVLVLVHRMVEFVVTEGPMFEAMIMNKEINNPDFNFLFDYQSPIHIYYRWKLYSIMHGESTKNWSMIPFRMYKDGPIWIPPTAPNYSDGMPDSLFIMDNVIDRTQLSQAQFNRLHFILRNLTITRAKINEGMLFCLNHPDAINDSISLIIDSMKGTHTSPVKQIARLYILSDVIRNCFTQNIKPKILNEDIDEMFILFENLHSTMANLKSDIDIKHFKSRVLKILYCWDTYKYFSLGVVKKMENKFLSVNLPNIQSLPDIDEDASSTDEPLDGASLLKRSLKNKNDNCIIPPIVNTRSKTQMFSSECFVASKWDTIDPEEVQAQAMSTEKLYFLEMENKPEKDVKNKENSKDEMSHTSREHKKGYKDEKQRKTHDHHRRRHSRK
ncbi:unnamed protein product [Brassicogethes aeneus]|uniref:U2 snRNP-associated SURP motif-containing protein n=1 Tax=Brassicogethes aeneus TaxID=1431903 RepID=A0A9P0B8F1_BRAAE|nr:unnamed protein product [Brassicogethes aeneus]